MIKQIKRLDFSLDERELKEIKIKADQIINILKNKLKKEKIKAEVFIGGSFAKGTLIKSDGYDVDIFVRFIENKDLLDNKLNNIVKEVCKEIKRDYEIMKGSREYYKIKDKNVDYEIVPVLKINNPKKAMNVTDLSYFHVNYAKNKITRGIAREIRLTKAFLGAQGVYGAESYIKGFSGYAVECLIIYYKSFEKFLKEIVKSREKIFIDLEKKYKNKQEAIISLNESKQKGPMILVDPTYKERNVLAGLSAETFDKLKAVAIKFLKNPEASYFEIKELNREKWINKFKEKNTEFVFLKIRTDRQEGDIAGTKMKKFYNFLLENIGKYFEVKDSQFIYSGKDFSEIWISLKSRGQLIKNGPPKEMIKQVKMFKKANKGNFYEKEGKIYARIKIDFTAEKYLKRYYMRNKESIREMGIVNLDIN